MSLFGAQPAAQTQTATTTPAKPTLSLFGNAPAASGGLFGSQGQNQTQNQTQNQQGSLFGGQNQTQTQQPATNSLFGGPTQNQQSTGSSLFGGQTQNQQPAGSSLFGGQTQNPQQQQQSQQPTGSSLFGAQAQSSTQQPQQQQQQQQGASILGGSLGAPSSKSLFSQSQQPQPGASIFARTQNHQSRLGASLADTLTRREKSVPDQIETVYRKWSPENPACLMQHYFYNTVPNGTAPFWGPGADDDEAKWEEALSKKPSENSVPVLARGFQALGNRLSMQVQAIQQLQMRLHEMNNSLQAMMQTRELSISVRASDAKKKHVGLSQKCLSLAIKVQVLRSRGFVLDSFEEDLKKQLTELEKTVFDPSLGGREEEIWARMVALRERSRYLTAESEKLGQELSDGKKAGLSAEVLRKTQKILHDYDVQMTHLRKELKQVTEDYKEWEATSGHGTR